MTKYHFTLIDGTACTQASTISLDRTPSNIAIIAAHAAKEKGCTASYFAGVGAYGSRVQQAINRVFAPRCGDVNAILEAAVADMKKAHADGKTIIVGGYSRGAAIARKVASAAGVPIKCLFALDTVASLGLPEATPPASDIEFVNATLSEHVEKAFHAVSLDETRAAFNPILFNDDVYRVHEEWFAGVHADIGGGLYDRGLSSIVLGAVAGWIAINTELDLDKLQDTAAMWQDARQPIIYNDSMPSQNRRMACVWQDGKPTGSPINVSTSVWNRRKAMYYVPRASKFKLNRQILDNMFR